MEKDNFSVLVGAVVVIIVSLTTFFVFKDDKVKEDDKKIDEGNIQNVDGKNQDDVVFNYLKLENNGSNIIYSPLSMQYSFKMLIEGAQGETRKQLEKIVVKENLNNYKSINNKLSLANGIFLSDEYKDMINIDYINKIQNQYNAELMYDDFSDVSNINNWIFNKTLGILEDIFKNEEINSEIKMLLINALAINMDWKNTFSEGSTNGSDFNGLIATTMKMVSKDNSISYYKDNEVTVLNMDLEELDDNKFMFSAVMPQGDLSEYINKFSVSKFSELLSKSIKASDTLNGIYLNIPKFSFVYDLKLKDDMISLGVTDLFDYEKADLSLINPGLFVSDIIQKAKIDFTEKGVKASAVSGTVISESSILDYSDYEEVHINRPFLFVISDKNNNDIWFVGTIYNPNLWENDKQNYTSNSSDN